MADISKIKMPDNQSYDLKDAAARQSIAALPTDVRVNGTSVVSNNIANIPVASDSKLGTVKIPSGLGIYINPLDGEMMISTASSTNIKEGDNIYRPLSPNKQHEAVFFGLSKLAGVNLANETVTLGIYPDSSKAAIQNLFGISDLLTNTEASTATVAHAANSLFLMDGKLHRATTTIAIGDAVTAGTNCEIVKADEVFVKNTDYTSTTDYGIIKLGYGFYTSPTTGQTSVSSADANQVKAANSSVIFVPTNRMHEAIFYGLSKVAGVDLANETVTVGTYLETSKTAIRALIGATSSNIIAVQDTQPTETDNKIWMLETPPEGIEVPTYTEFQALDAAVVKKTDIATSTTAGIVKVASSNGVAMTNDGQIYINQASVNNVKQGTANYFPIVPSHQHEAAFYGLAKAAGDTTQASSDNAVGTYTADASAAIRSMLGAVGKTEYATYNSPGIVQVDPNYGIALRDSPLQYVLMINRAGADAIKEGTNTRKPITPSEENYAVFYGLSKAAGVNLASETVTFGTYPNTSKTAIQSMLGIEANIPLIETVSGTTPSITGMPNVRYICGEVSTISITPPASGSIVVRFESGSTATTMTVSSTVKWPAWFDATALDTNAVYEVIITDGTYGSVMTWAT